jgi:hypothetical protein
MAAAAVTRLLAAAACAVMLACGAPAALGATVSVDGFKDAIYTAAPGEANRLAVDDSSSAGIATFRDAGAAIVPGPGCTAVGDGAVTCTAGGSFAPAVQVDLGDGDDVLSLHGGGMLATLGPGADRAFADAGRIQVEGGPGPDAVSGSDGADVEVDYYDHVVGVRVTLDGRANDGAPGEGDDLGPGVRIVDGTAHGDVLDARGAHERVALSGSFGNDRLYASPAGGFMDGGTGADVLRGGPGRDDIRGEEGDDVISGAGGADSVGGQAGRNVVTGGRGRDRYEVSALGGDVVNARDGARDVIVCDSLPRRLELDAADKAPACAAAVGANADPSHLLAHRRVRLVLVCGPPRPGGCRGTLRLTDTAPQPLARARFTIRAGRRIHLTVRLTHAPRKGFVTAVVVNHRAHPPAASRTTVTTFQLFSP